MADTSHGQGEPTGRYLALLSLTALGVVYGDIGTSVLYAVRESFHHAHGIDPTPRNVLGVLSLVFWARVRRERLFAVMSRNARTVTSLFGLRRTAWWSWGRNSSCGVRKYGSAEVRGPRDCGSTKVEGGGCRASADASVHRVREP